YVSIIGILVAVLGSRYKTSVYIDRELWEKLRNYARRRNMEISKLLEELIREGIVEEELIEVLDDMVEEETIELDFEPILIEAGEISSIVREMRDERSNRISRY
ncbi:MAG: ribbon-helix-helix domain-containing protein, partial [Desulfurococcales archaeon]|nr:ribbon-helix-helix domain-containing protein [Desulfurococcales archaeon]